MTRISVIIPFYNRIRWLEKAIDSVLSQTFRDFEIILVNDGSTETFSLDRLPPDPRIRYLEQENRGASSARNRGLDAAEGDYIAFLDSDDLFVPEKLATQLEFMEARPEITLSHTSFDKIDREGYHIDTVHSATDAFNEFPLLLLNCSIALPTVMLRRDVVRQSGVRFDESIAVGEDIIFWATIAERYPIAALDEVLTKVRIHGENAAHRPEAQLIANQNIIEHIRKNIRSTTETRKLVAEIYINCFFHSFSNSRGISRLLSFGYVLKGLAHDPFNPRFWREPRIHIQKIKSRWNM